MKNIKLTFSACSLLIAFFAFFSQGVNAQKMDGIERSRMKTMLKNLKKAIEKDYYDPEFHGVNLDERFKKAEDRMDEIQTTGQGLAVIAQVLMDFNDSHLYFQPPLTNLDVEYGWRMDMFGDKAYIVTVKPHSDAEAKGLKVGDQVLMIENFRPAKSEMWKMDYYYNILSKRQNINLTVLSPGEEKPRQINIESKITQRPNSIDEHTIFTLIDSSGRANLDKHLFVTLGGIAVWKMPTFAFDPQDVNLLMSKVKDSSSLILDLRGNGGGYVDTLEQLAGYIFDKDLKIADLKGRKEMKPQISKTKGEKSYKGKLVVLIDADSGSAAEIFARLVQLENRGKVLGDVSAGAVMQAKHFSGSLSNDAIFYGASITDADVIMSDGKSLEHVGVQPDELILPTGADLAGGKDPVMARAFEILGAKITAEQAGNFFQYKWKNDKLFLDLGSN